MNCGDISLDRMMLTWMVLVVLMKALILNVTALGLDKGCVVKEGHFLHVVK